ncbi:hypothetical protein [Microbacterium enclense]|uniref:Uncharacterized protein n=1 Tax=Microbacterium enclense TaxID=993073 RepID=A0A1G6NSW0_9MICO|nr:hypothetical protein [Microbacterium enclense]SDC71080.1 hypothetical protein SAMN05216418_2844 [Microbacterium enclense]
MDEFPRCAHCGQRIERINFALGPEWRHWPSPYGNYRTSEKYRICHSTTVATPTSE